MKIYMPSRRTTPYKICCKLGENRIRKGIDVTFILIINQMDAISIVLRLIISSSTLLYSILNSNTILNLLAYATNNTKEAYIMGA